MNTRPIQTVSYKEKIKNLGEPGSWGVNNIDHWINNSIFSQRNLLDKARFYRLYNNEIKEEDFNHFTNPYNSTNPKYQNFPAKIRQYGFLRPNIDLLLGEFSKRPFIFNVKPTGAEHYSKLQEELFQQVVSGLQNVFLSELQAQGIDVEAEKPELPEQIKAKFLSNYKDELVTQAHNILDYILEKEYVLETVKDVFKDYIISGETISYKQLINDRLYYERVSPIECDFDKSSKSKYIEDGQWFVRRMLLGHSEIIDMFPDLTKEEVDQLVNYANRFSQPFYYNPFPQTSPDDNRSKIEVYHTQWKSVKKVGFYTYFDEETLQMITEEVDETFKKPKDVDGTIVWEYQTEVWEGYRIDGRLYKGIRRVPFQRNTSLGFTSCKLNYNGRRFSDIHTTNISPLQMGIPFLIMYIIIQYKIELTLAKSKGKIVLLDKNVIPTEEGHDEETFMYYSDAIGWGLIDRSDPSVDKTYNQYQVLDLGLFDHIKHLIELRESYKQEWDDLLGITRQRKGQTTASDGLGATQVAIVQSSVITEELFTGFEQFVQRELQGILDLAKLINPENLTSAFIKDDIVQFMKPTEDFPLAELGVFISRSAEVQRRKEILEQAAVAAASAQGKLSQVAEVLEKGANFTLLKNKLKEIEEREMIFAQQQAKSDQEAQAQMEEIRRENLEFEHFLDMEKLAYENDRKDNQIILKGDIDLNAKGAIDVNMNNVLDINEIEKRNIDREKIYADKEIRSKELQLKERDVDNKLKIEDKKIKQIEIQNANQERLAKMKADNDQKLADKKIELANIQIKKAKQKPKTQK